MSPVQIPAVVAQTVLQSILRTVVPFAIGWLVTFLAVPDDVVGWLEQLLVVVIGTGYYALVRLLETYGSNAWGWFLGLAKQPAYVPTTADIAPATATANAPGA